jgi:hypothetical protein
MVKIDGSQRIPFFTLVDDNGGFIQANQLPVFVPEPSSVIVFASTGLAVGGAMWLRYKRRHAASHLGQAIS